jgi:hypothetical protein
LFLLADFAIFCFEPKDVLIVNLFGSGENGFQVFFRRFGLVLFEDFEVEFFEVEVFEEIGLLNGEFFWRGGLKGFEEEF